MITSAVTFCCLMVSLLDISPTLSSDGAHQLFLAAFQAQLWPFEKGPLPPTLLAMAECTIIVT